MRKFWKQTQLFVNEDGQVYFVLYYVEKGTFVKIPRSRVDGDADDDLMT